MDLMKVEHIGFWLMYYMLLAAILIQSFSFEDGFRLATAEWIIFMLTSIICVIGWIIKRGCRTNFSATAPFYVQGVFYTTASISVFSPTLIS
jgi:hypothetical protein